MQHVRRLVAALGVTGAGRESGANPAAPARVNAISHISTET
jgi:hypothetical protein